jgi:hypothetical protein
VSHKVSDTLHDSIRHSLALKEQNSANNSVTTCRINSRWHRHTCQNRQGVPSVYQLLGRSVKRLNYITVLVICVDMSW